jgi:ABC-type transport system substrate-binding protein
MMRRCAAAVLAGAFALGAVACSGGSKGNAASTTTTTSAGSTASTASTSTTVDLSQIQSVDPTATDAESGGRAFARLYAAQLRVQANGAMDDTQTQCVEDQMIAVFGGARILQLANTSYTTMPREDLAKLVQLMQGCGLTSSTLATLGINTSTTTSS